MGVKPRRLLINVLLANLRPMIVRAGRFLPMNLHTFVMVCIYNSNYLFYYTIIRYKKKNNNKERKMYSGVARYPLAWGPRGTVPPSSPVNTPWRCTKVQAYRPVSTGQPLGIWHDIENAILWYDMLPEYWCTLLLTYFTRDGVHFIWFMHYGFNNRNKW